jgi:TldD protein
MAPLVKSLEPMAFTQAMPDRDSLISAQLAGSIIRRALSRCAGFAELYVEQRTGLDVSLKDEQVRPTRASIEEGVGLRVVRGASTYFGYVDGLTEASLLGLASAVSGAAGSVPHGANHGFEDRRPPSAEIAISDLECASELLRACDAAARGAARKVTQVIGTAFDNHSQIEIQNSDGLVATEMRRHRGLFVEVVARLGGRVASGWETVGVRSGSISAQQAEAVAKKAAEKALTMLEASKAPTGEMPVVVGNGLGGVLLHEAVGHGLEADEVRKGASVYAGKLGDRIAPKFVSAYDDGRLLGGWASGEIDDEGTPTQVTNLIQEGQLSAYLYDRVLSTGEGGASTGNGRRASFRHQPLPRMTNTYFGPGDASPGELIEELDRGIYAASLGGGQVDPVTGDFVFSVSEGYVIEGGKITNPIRGATLVGNSREALLAIDGIGNDLDFAPAFCRKSGQLLPVGVGQPHMRLRALTVGGTEV